MIASDAELQKLASLISEYNLAHPEQFLAAMKSYTIYEKRNSHVDHSIQLSGHKSNHASC